MLGQFGLPIWAIALAFPLGLLGVILFYSLPFYIYFKELYLLFLKYKLLEFIFKSVLFLTTHNLYQARSVLHAQRPSLPVLLTIH